VDPAKEDAGRPMKRYTCNDYRLEMMLAGMRRRLADPGLNEDERERLRQEIRLLEREMGLED